MQSVAEVLPFTHGIEAAREVADGATLGDVAGLVATEALIGRSYVVVGYAVLRWIEVVSRAARDAGEGRPEAEPLDSPRAYASSQRPAEPRRRRLLARARERVDEVAAGWPAQELGELGEIEQPVGVPGGPVGIVAVGDPVDDMVRLGRLVQQLGIFASGHLRMQGNNARLGVSCCGCSASVGSST